MKLLALMALAAMSSVQAMNPTMNPRMAGGNPADAAFILDMGPYLTFSRMDPIVAPGEVAGHVHLIGGASNFRNVLNTPEEQLRAKCTTMPISADKSNYWVPAVYWINKNNTYSIMAPYNRLYYITSGVNVGEVQPFPPGLRMVSGNSQARPGSSLGVIGAYSNLERGTTNRQFIMNGTVHPNAPEYLMANIHFPSCGWANQSLDSADHFSHMAFPIDQGGGLTWPDVFGGQCPDTHPIRYPHLFIETNLRLLDWQKEEWNKEGPNFIISNGDTTGLNWHGDFVNGWEPSVLNNAINNCRVGDGLANCPAFDGLIQTQNQRRSCRLEGMIPNEEVGLTGAIDELPGCNPRWDWAPRDKPSCANPKPAPGYIAPQLQLNTYSVELPLIWHGVDKTNVSTIPHPAVGNFDMYGTDQPVVWSWASRFNGSVPIDLPDVTHGNGGNADDDAAGVKIAIVPGQQDTTDWRDDATANPIQLTDAINASKQGARFNQTWWCSSDSSWYGYQPCTAPPDTADEVAPVASPAQSTASSAANSTGAGAAADTATATGTNKAPVSLTSSATTTSAPGGALVGTAGVVSSGTDAAGGTPTNTADATDATVTGSSNGTVTAAAGTPTNTHAVIADPSGLTGSAPANPVTPTATRKHCKPKGKRSRVAHHHF